MESCSVFGCNKTYINNQHTFLFPIPALETSGTLSKHLSAVRQEKWLKSLGIPDANKGDVESYRVCHEHFITGSPSSLPDHKNPDWVPTLNLDHFRRYRYIKDKHGGRTLRCDDDTFRLVLWVTSEQENLIRLVFKLKGWLYQREGPIISSATSDLDLSEADPQLAMLVASRVLEEMPQTATIDFSINTCGMTDEEVDRLRIPEAAASFQYVSGNDNKVSALTSQWLQSLKCPMCGFVNDTRSDQVSMLKSYINKPAETTVQTEPFPAFEEDAKFKSGTCEFIRVTPRINKSGSKHSFAGNVYESVLVSSAQKIRDKVANKVRAHLSCIKANKDFFAKSKFKSRSFSRTDYNGSQKLGRTGAVRGRGRGKTAGKEGRRDRSAMRNKKGRSGEVEAHTLVCCKEVDKEGYQSMFLNPEDTKNVDKISNRKRTIDETEEREEMSLAMRMSLTRKKGRTHKPLTSKRLAKQEMHDNSVYSHETPYIKTEIVDDSYHNPVEEEESDGDEVHNGNDMEDAVESDNEYGGHIWTDSFESNNKSPGKEMVRLAPTCDIEPDIPHLTTLRKEEVNDLSLNKQQNEIADPVLEVGSSLSSVSDNTNSRKRHCQSESKWLNKSKAVPAKPNIYKLFDIVFDKRKEMRSSDINDEIESVEGREHLPLTFKKDNVCSPSWDRTQDRAETDSLPGTVEDMPFTWRKHGNDSNNKTKSDNILARTRVNTTALVQSDSKNSVNFEKLSGNGHPEKEETVSLADRRENLSLAIRKDILGKKRKSTKTVKN